MYLLVLNFLSATLGLVRLDSEKMGYVRWEFDWRNTAVNKKSSANTLRMVKVFSMFLVLNFLSATDPPSARQKVAKQNGGPVGKSN